jgi:hypothetical protein
MQVTWVLSQCLPKVLLVAEDAASEICQSVLEGQGLFLAGEITATTNAQVAGPVVDAAACSIPATALSALLQSTLKGTSLMFFSGKADSSSTGSDRGSPKRSAADHIA